MIVADTSAIAAIFFREPEADLFERRFFGPSSVMVAAPTALEFLLVAGGQRARSRSDGPALLDSLGCIIVPWTDQHRATAHAAFLRFGKGRGHPAQLNFGDCMSYALARSLNAPLLYKGDDFARTDIRPAL